MSNVTALRSDCISPEIVVESVANELPNIAEIFVVAITKDKDPLVWATSDLSNLCFAAIVLQDMATKLLNGEIK